MRTKVHRTLLRGASWATRSLHGDSVLPMGEAPRILAIRPDHLGDLLFATPALHYLRDALPGARVSALVGPWGRPVLDGNPDVDEILTCPCPGFTRQPKKSLWAPYLLLIKEAKKLRGRFDVALNLRFDFWWGAFLAYWARIPVRIGYDLAESRPFLTQCVPYLPGRHEVVQNMSLVAALLDEGAASEPGPLAFYPRDRDRQWSDRFLADMGAPPVIIHPGAGARVKLWRPEGWGRVADRLAEEFNARILLTGGPGEECLLRAVAQHMRTSPQFLAGETTLGQLGALMVGARLVMGVDSGPLHLAVAMGCPTVHLYGPVDHRSFGPWGDPDRHRVVVSPRCCVPCNRLDYEEWELADHTCVKDIPEGEVLSAAREAMRSL